MKKLTEAHLTLKVAAFVGISLAWFQNAGGQQAPRQLIPSHGTVNVLLADENGLVAVTDSALTAGDTHTTDGRKLFKLDDRTVCMMAGAYRTPALDGSPSLEFLVPGIMDDFKAGRIDKNITAMSFEDKAARVSYIVSYQMTNNFQALVSDGVDISSFSPLYLTLAGYDLDGTLKVAELAFIPSRNESGAIALPTIRTKSKYEPLLLCEISRGLERHALSTVSENIRIRKMGKPFFCEAIGLSTIVEQILNNPGAYLQLPQVARYAAFTKGGSKLTTQEMKELALELEIRRR